MTLQQNHPDGGLVISIAEGAVVVQVETPLAVAKVESHSNQTYEGLEAPLGFLERALIDVVYCFFHITL